MSNEHDALWQLQRDLEAERRHVNPERMRRERGELAVQQLVALPAGSDAIREICDAVVGPTSRRGRRTA